MLDERAAKHGTRGAIFGLCSLLENGGVLVGNDCENLRHGSPIGAHAATSVSPRSSASIPPECHPRKTKAPCLRGFLVVRPA
jgi:hypothetical protein